MIFNNLIAFEINLINAITTTSYNFYSFTKNNNFFIINLINAITTTSYDFYSFTKIIILFLVKFMMRLKKRNIFIEFWDIFSLLSIFFLLSLFVIKDFLFYLTFEDFDLALLSTLFKTAKKAHKGGHSAFSKNIKPSSSLGQTDVPKRTYAKDSVNKPEKPKNITDPKGLLNNPVTKKGRHYESQRQECKENSNCKEQECPVICGTDGQRQSTGHFTSNPPASVYGNNTVHKVSNTNLNNEAKEQWWVAYENPHTTTKTQEHINGTAKLNNDPQFKKEIKNHEDKK